MNQHWSQLKEQNTGYLRLQFLLKIYQIFGRLTLQIMVLPIVLGVFIFSKPLRVFSRKYLDHIYQFQIKHQKPTIKKPNSIAVFWHLFAFADSLIDKVISWVGNIGFDQINVQTQETFDEMIQELKDGKPPFLICSHLGNMEVLRAMGNFQNSDLINKKIVVHSIIQANHSPKFNEFLKKINPKTADNLTTTTNIGIDTMIGLKEKLQNGEIVVIAGDRTAAQNENKSIVVDFLGDPAHFPIGSFTIASLIESPIYFIFCVKAHRGKSYNLYLYKPKVNFDCSRSVRKERVEELMQEYVSNLEGLCLKYPSQWYNFFDFWRA